MIPIMRQGFGKTAGRVTGLLLVCLTGIAFSAFVLAEEGSPEETVNQDECQRAFERTGVCPKNVCRLKCAAQERQDKDASAFTPSHSDGSDRQGLDSSDRPQKDACDQPICEPIPCAAIPRAQCPLQRCDLYVDCSGEWVCDEKVWGGYPECGRTAYAGQEVPCCPGYQRRCGVAFIDNSCDMEGRHSMYRFPICIPCGDGVCQQFENICNCPEDCGGKKAYQGLNIEKALQQLDKYKEKLRLQQNQHPPTDASL